MPNNEKNVIGDSITEDIFAIDLYWGGALVYWVVACKTSCKHRIK